MARRSIHKLSAKDIARLTSLKPGAKGLPKRGSRLVGDGGQLYVQLMPSGSASWAFRHVTGGKETKLGLGPLHTVTPDEAREKARQLRRRLIDGDEVRLGPATIIFREAAEQYIATQEPAWRNAQSGVQWRQSLNDYVIPVIGDVPVDKIDTPAVHRLLERERFWYEHPVTAARVRGRIESILDWAKVRGFRTGENPARWKGNLKHLLPAQNRLHEVKPQPALPYQRLPELMVDLAARDGVQALALQFVLLTACRTGDLIGSDPQNPQPMLWSHVDEGERLWVIPRGKNNKTHHVPLSLAALRILRVLRPYRDPKSDIVFPGATAGRAISASGMRRVIAGLNVARRRQGLSPFLDPDGHEVTVHGTARGGFKTWAEEATNTKTAIIEAALSHTIESALERSYRRTDFIAARRELMNEWAEYLESDSLQEAHIAA
jgi:integrase